MLAACFIHSGVILADENEIVEVPDLATLRAEGQTDQTVYRVTGEIILTHQNGNRNQKYFQDDTGAILVDDMGGIITTVYDEYDGITGLTGTLSFFNQMLQWIPVEDPGEPTSTGNLVEPLEIELADLAPEHQAMLIQLEDVAFVSPPHANFHPSTSYPIEDSRGPGILRTPHFNAGLDYFGQPIPLEPLNMIAIVGQFQSEMQVFPRSLADMDYTPEPDPDPELVDVPDIAAFKAVADGPDIYRITGEVVITHLQRPFRNQFFVQDATGALLVDDVLFTITTEYELYDGITGLTGNLTVFQNMMQLLPFEDPGEASSQNNVIEPMEVTLSELNEELQGMLALVRSVHFAEENPEIWMHNTTYYIFDGTGTGEIRTPNYPDLLDYFGLPVPDTPQDIAGVLHQRYDITRLIPRMLADFSEAGDPDGELPGDSNCDGTVNVLDVITSVNYFVGLDPHPFCFENADVNGDGVINILDVIATVDIFLE